MGEITKIRCLAAETAFGSEKNKPVTALAWLDCYWLACREFP